MNRCEVQNFRSNRSRTDKRNQPGARTYGANSEERVADASAHFAASISHPSHTGIFKCPRPRQVSTRPFRRDNFNAVKCKRGTFSFYHVRRTGKRHILAARNMPASASDAGSAPCRRRAFKYHSFAAGTFFLLPRSARYRQRAKEVETSDNRVLRHRQTHLVGTP